LHISLQPHSPNHINLIANKPIDFNSLIENKYKQIEFEKRDYFESKMNKARRCISKPFRVFIKSKNTKDNNNTSVFHNSTLNQSSSSHPYVNSSFNGNNNNHNSNANSPSEFTNHSNRSDNFNNRLISTPNRNKKLSNNNHYNGGRYSNYQENNYRLSPIQRTPSGLCISLRNKGVYVVFICLKHLKVSLILNKNKLLIKL